MGTWGTFTGIVDYFDPVTKIGHRLVLKDGELQTDITGDYWASGATGYDEGSGFWLDRQFTGGSTISAGTPIGLLLPLTYAADVSSPAIGTTRLFFGDSAGNKVTWDGTTLTIVGTISATDGDIGDWTIAPTALYKDTGVAATSAGMSPSDFPFYAGAVYANRANATWRVTPAGKMYIEGTMYVSGSSSSLVIGSGWGTEPVDNRNVCIGYQSGDGLTSGFNVTLGYQSGSGVTGGGNSIFIGSSAGKNYNSANPGIGIGYQALQSNTAANVIGIGINAGINNAGDQLIALGGSAGSGNSGTYVIAIGHSTGFNNTYDNLVLIGDQVSATAANQIVFGSYLKEYTDLFGGGGVSQASPPAFTVNATGGLGTDIAGAALNLAGGRGTGTGAGGAVVIQTAPAGSTGSSQNALVDRAWVNPDGSFDFTQWQQMPEISDPAAPATNYARLYARDNGSGKTQLCVRFPTGAVQVLATEP